MTGFKEDINMMINLFGMKIYIEKKWNNIHQKKSMNLCLIKLILLKSTYVPIKNSSIL